MQITKNTLDILRNFASINSVFYVDDKTPGKIRTVSQSGGIVAIADVPEDFPPFQVYDLSQFLGALALFPNPELSFGPTSVTISSDNASISYSFCSPALVNPVPPKGVNMPPVDVQFVIDKKNFSQILKASGALGLSNLVVTPADDGKVCVSLASPENSEGNSNKFSLLLECEKKELSKFKAIFQVSSLQFVAGSYRVSLSSKKFARFESIGDTVVPVSYYLGMESSSTFE